MKLVHTPLNVSFLKTLETFLEIFLYQERKVTLLFQSQLFQSQLKNLTFLCFFIYIFKKKLRMLWFIKQNKNIITYLL